MDVAVPMGDTEIAEVEYEGLMGVELVTECCDPAFGS